MRIRIFDDLERLAVAAADEIAAWLRIDGPGATFGLAGGSTPRATYEALRHQDLPWEQVTAWMTDERFVPPGHPDRNAGMARRTLFDHVPAVLHEVPWGEKAAEAAAEYEDVLRGLFPAGTRPGLVLLGIGEDGHTASLFPGTEALDVDRRGFVANWVPELAVWRLTATIPLLCEARRVMFLVSGGHKAARVADILERESDCPAAVVARCSRDAVWLMDRDAASLLEDRNSA